MLFLPKLLMQVPSILHSIEREHKWLEELAKTRRIDGIISDNRYGLYHSDIPNVILTHQLCIQTGFGILANSLVQYIHYRFLEKFNACWVVDILEAPGLSGELAHPKQLPNNAQYIGLLSQMDEIKPVDILSDYILILLSGPEPQRTILHNILWKQCLQLDRKVVFVAGSKSAIIPSSIPSHITYYQQAGQDILGPLLRDASFVICRSGYSTLMDLVALRKKAILIPTPGQTEQEYLGRQLQDSGLFSLQYQSSINLTSAFSISEELDHGVLKQPDNFRHYESLLTSWIDTL